MRSPMASSSTKRSGCAAGAKGASVNVVNDFGGYLRTPFGDT
jgi:hypothetical protein